MKKPHGYDDSEVIENGFREPEPGAYILGVVKVQTTKNSKKQQQLILMLDIAEGEFKNYFTKLSKKINKNMLLRHFQNTEGKGLPYFKGMIKNFEKSNSGYSFTFSESSLINKKIGSNLRGEEYERTRDGSIQVALRIAYLCSVESVRSGKHKILPIKKLKVSTNNSEPGINEIPPEEYNQELPNYNENDLPF